MIELMFPLETQAKIAKLHLAFVAGMKAESIHDQIQSQIDELEISLKAKGRNGIVSKQLNSLSAELISSQIKSLTSLNVALTAPLIQLQKDALGAEAKNGAYAEAYESIIEDANNNGAAIFDSVMKFAHKSGKSALEDAIYTAENLAALNGFKLECRMVDGGYEQYDCYVEFYTTSKGLRVLNNELLGAMAEKSLLSDYKKECFYYQMPLNTPALHVLVEESKKMHLAHGEDAITPFCDRMITASFIGVKESTEVCISEIEEFEKNFSFYKHLKRQFERYEYDITQNWMSSSLLKQIVNRKTELNVEEIVNLITA